MNLGKLIQLVEKGVQRRDLSAQYKDTINGAIRSIQEEYSFTCMKHTDEVTMRAGAQWVSLPSDFKEFQRGRGVVRRVLADGGYLPIDLAGRSLTQRMGSRWRPSAVTHNMFWLEFQNDCPVLRGNCRAMNEGKFQVAYYRYLPPLEKKTDDNYITRTWPQMVVHRAKSDLFALINDDERTASSEKLYQMEFKKAYNTDARREISGVRYQT
jgi:hypothetical protein